MFSFSSPTSLDEVKTILKNYDGKVKFIAGGTDLIPKIAYLDESPDLVMDIKRIPSLKEIKWDNSLLTLGASVPCFEVYENERISKAFPAVVDAASIIGGIQIQSRATLGGNLCNASPSADSICPLIVHDAVANIDGEGGKRKVLVKDFCLAPGKSVLLDNEVLVSIELPVPTTTAPFGSAYKRFTPRNEMDIAVVGVSASVSFFNKECHIKIALAGVGPTPIFALDTRAKCSGTDIVDAQIEQLAIEATKKVAPIDDMRGTIEHRKSLTKVFVKRVLAEAIGRAKWQKK